MFYVVLISFVLTYGECVFVSPQLYSRIRQAITFFEEAGSDHVILFQEWPTCDENVQLHEYLSPPILVWDALKVHSSICGSLSCPFCDETSSILQRQGMWTDGSERCSYEPRTVYDTSFSILLVSAVYQCPNRHQVPAHHPSVLAALRSFVYVPFFLTNRAGFTISMLTQITSLVDCGLSFHSIDDIFRDQYEQHYWRRRQQYEQGAARSEVMTTEVDEFPEFNQADFPYPHENLINKVFVSFSSLFENVFYEDMSERTGTWLSCHHTFKSAANIGFVRQSDNRWIKLFKCIFCIMNEEGKILHWRFTRGESFEEVKDMFTELRKRFESKGVTIQGIIIDNCCKWNACFQLPFPMFQ